MKKDYTHVVVVLDRSGSMAFGSTWEETCGAYGNLVEDQKKGEGKCSLSLFAFDDQFEQKLDFIDINKVSGKIDFRPRGLTRLCDAIGRSINETKEKVEKMPERDRPGNVIFMIQTDGGENDSKEFDREAAAKIRDKCKQDLGWEFVFLGASEESIQEAKAMNFDAGRTVQYNAGEKTGDTFNAVSSKMLAYRSVNCTISEGSSCSDSLDFSEAEKEALQ